MSTYILSVVLIVLASAAWAEEAATQPAFKSVMDAYNGTASSLRNNDTTSLSDWLADDLTLIDHEGKTNDKPALLKAMTDKIITFKRLDAGRVTIKKTDDVAVLQGPIELALLYGRDTPVEVSGRFALTSVFVQQEGKWRLSAAQLTLVKPPKK